MSPPNIFKTELIRIDLKHKIKCRRQRRAELPSGENSKPAHVVQLGFETWTFDLVVVGRLVWCHVTAYTF